MDFLQLTTLKPLHAQWITELYNHMTTEEGEKIILSGWKTSGIRKALDEGLVKLAPLDPYSDIDALVSPAEADCDISQFLEMSEEDRQALGFGESYREDSNDDDEDDDIFEPERNFTDVFNSLSEE